jgi:hypothetical protein
MATVKSADRPHETHHKPGPHPGGGTNADRLNDTVPDWLSNPSSPLHLGSFVAPGSKPRTNLRALRPDVVLGLQRVAGNRAVQRFLSPSATPVQRFSITPADFDASIGKSTTGFLGIGASSYATIRKTFSDYLKARDSAKPDVPRQVKLLERLDDLCTRWINDHRGGTSAQDKSRVSIIKSLVDEITPERAALSRKLAQGVYLENAADKTGEHGLEALTVEGMGAAKKALGRGKGGFAPGPEGQALSAAKGLSPAEQTAIGIYSAQDYMYINPATANSPGWMASQTDKSDPTAAANKWDELHATPEGKKALMQEGSLHAGVAMQGLSKMDPFVGDCYRGATYTEADFQEKIGVGKTVTFNSLTSSSKAMRVGLGWASKTTPVKNIAVFSIFSSTGGRDISQLSMYKKEEEVLILPGSSFVAVSVTEVVDGLTGYPEVIEKMKESSAKKWYIVHLKPVPKQGAAAPKGAAAP